MKKRCLLLGAALLFPSLPTVSHAAIVTGNIFCDANQNGVIDAGDPGVPGVVVVITNENYSFSNAAVTASDGSFSVQIPDFSALKEVSDPLSQIYVETLSSSSLPANSTIVIPTAVTNITSNPAYFISFATTNNQTNLVFTSGMGDTSTGDWLLNNPECGSAGNGITNGNCKVTGDAHVLLAGGIDHNCDGKIVGGDRPKGQWIDSSRALNLVFRSKSIQSVVCGTGIIEFSGTGTLKSLRGGSRTVETNEPVSPNRSIETNQLVGPIFFTVEIESVSTTDGHRNETADAYYFRAYTADGTTLEVVNGDDLDPTDIVPVPTFRGNFRMKAQ
jgi:hypothetical protein